MEFSFTEDQTDFAAAVADLLANEAGPTVLRKVWDDDHGSTVWGQLADMGVLGIMAPEPSGGLGMTDIDAVLLTYEAGRVALADPLAEVASVAIPTLVEAAANGSALSGRCEELVAAMANGTHQVAVAVEPDGLVREGADSYILQSSDGLHLVDAADIDVAVSESVDGSRRVGEFSWEPTESTLLTSDPSAVRAAGDRVAIAHAATLCGLSQTMLDMTVEYASERKQFGVPIGSFQAIKHQLADALIALEFAKPVVWRAANSMSKTDPDASTHASMAKAVASDAAMTVARASLQCHGAIAYTTEYDLHLYMKRAWALVAAGGDATYHRKRVAAAIL